MKSLQRGIWCLLILLLPGCWQQLVEFPLASDQSVPADLARPPDVAAPLDIAAPPDSAAPLDQSVARDLSMPDLSPPPGPLTACAATLGTARSFAVLGGSTVTNTGMTTRISGSVGVSPGLAIVGIPAGQPTSGFIDIMDAVAAQAQMDVTSVYSCSEAAHCNTMLTGTDLGGLTLFSPPSTASPRRPRSQAPSSSMPRATPARSGSSRS